MSKRTPHLDEPVIWYDGIRYYILGPSRFGWWLCQHRGCLNEVSHFHRDTTIFPLNWNEADSAWRPLGSRKRPKA